METQTQSIEEIAEKMLLWKFTETGDLPCCPAKQPKLFSQGIQHLVGKGYLVKKIEDSKPVYHITINGSKHVESYTKL